MYHSYPKPKMNWTLSQIAYWFDLMLPVEATLTGGKSFNSRFALGQTMRKGLPLEEQYQCDFLILRGSAPTHVLSSVGEMKCGPPDKKATVKWAHKFKPTWPFMTDQSLSILLPGQKILLGFEIIILIFLLIYSFSWSTLFIIC